MIYYTSMKLTAILKVFLFSVLMLSFVNCEKAPEQKVESVYSDVTISLDVDKLNLDNVNIRVRHDGGAAMNWVYMVTSDLTTDADVLIEEQVAKELEFNGELVVYSGQNKSIHVDRLTPKEYYRFICKAVDPETGKTVGKVAEIEFRTKRDPSVFIRNDSWSIQIGDRVISNTDNMEYDTFICRSEDSESYVVVPIKDSDFIQYYNNDVRAFIEDYHSDFGLPEGDSKWKSIVKTGDCDWTEQRLRSSEWRVYMIGIDQTGELSGLYQLLEFVIEEEVATEEYNRWLGTWMVHDTRLNIDLFEINILPSENNMWYYLAGWEGDNLYFDTYDYSLMIETYFDKYSGKMSFISQYVNTLDTGSESIDFYFSGTFTYGQNYVIDATNYRMAEAQFLDVNYNTARIEGGSYNAGNTSFPIQQICYFYYSGSSPGSISLDIPDLPLNLRRVTK